MAIAADYAPGERRGRVALPDVAGSRDSEHAAADRREQRAWRIIGSVTPLAIGSLVVAGGFAFLDWWAVATERLAVERVAKPAVMVALIVATLTLEPVVAEPVRLLVLVALGASLIGDMLLLPGGSFVGAVLAFAAAHLAYAASFALRGLAPAPLVVGATIGTVLAVVVGRPILRGAQASLRPLVAGYQVLVLAMAVLATGTLAPLAILGAWSFVASDATLGWSRFAIAAGDDRPGPRVAVHATYHVAQALLVLALLT